MHTAVPAVADRRSGAGVDGAKRSRSDARAPTRALRHGTATFVHGAQYSTEIIAALAALDPPLEGRIHDPFAGTGQRLGQLCDRLGLTFTGTEIEQSFIVDSRASRTETPPTRPPIHRDVNRTRLSRHRPTATAATTTSPPLTHIERNTYRAWVAVNEGTDRELHINNQGRYGFRGRGPDSGARRAYWRVAAEVVACWTGARRAVVNVKDYTTPPATAPSASNPSSTTGPTSSNSSATRSPNGSRVPTPGLRYGANHDARIDHEVILDGKRP